ncbi:MAG: hypothetical protein MUC56_08335 [Thermoanaerobaculales bacterium]|jgi:hypothetical protein|nr:hypothetical protein [Thermoanaerobaculales bacterium]
MGTKARTVVKFTATVAIVAISTLVMTGCDGEADHWIVIHDKAAYDGASRVCKPPMPSDDVAFLPTCLSVKNGETVGFYNFTEKDFTITHFGALNAPDPFTLKAGNEAVYKVIARDKLVQFDIKSTVDHGGPDMIVQP